MPGGAPIGASDLTVSYLDTDQSTYPSFIVAQIKGDGDTVIEPGELFDIEVNLTSLATPLGTSTDFIIIIQPMNGSSLHLERTTPDSLDAYNYLG